MNVTYYNGVNGHPPTPVPDVPASATSTLASLVVPADTVWVTDFINGWGSFQCVWTSGNEPPIITNVSPRTLGSGGWLREIHQGRTNVLYCDGHAHAETLDFLAQRPKSNPTTGVYCHWTVEDDCN